MVRELILGVLALCGFLGSLTSHAERPERLRLIGVVPSGFEQTLQLHFTHFKVDEYTASANHDAVKNTRIRLEQHRGPLPLDLAGTLKHYESTNMARCQAPERTTIFQALNRITKPPSCLRSALNEHTLTLAICGLPKPFWLMPYIL